jgi:signal transduction histidine kinase
MLDGVRASGERAAGIVQDMLNYSRRSDSSIELCDLNKLIDEVVNICSCDYDLTRRYDFKQVDVRRHYDPGCAQVPCIPTEIKQVVFNLVRNAAHAMAGGETPRAPRIDLTTRMRPGEAVVEVADNGPGFDEETRKRLFEPFFTTKPAGLGTGLGLSVSFFVVTENHGGALEAESIPGRGATFRVRLPLARRDA